MPQVPIIMPQLGESIAEATIIQFLVKPGDEVTADQDVIEVETNKATMNVAAPCTGKIGKWSAEIDQSYPVGSVLGQLEVTEDIATEMGLDAPTTNHSKESETPQETPETPQKKLTVEPTIKGLPVPANAASVSYISPRMKARMQELGLHSADLAGVAGTGAGGRVTIQDFERFIADLEKQRLTPASSMRVAVADAMRRSWTRPLATVGLESQLDNLLSHRRQCDPKPGPALYAMRALGIALSENSAIAGRLVGQKIVHPSSIDIGFAVEADDGVLVPVIREVDKRTLGELVQVYNDLVEKARNRRLPTDATGGSIATVTNFGTFGLVWATPIPLPEQTLVLGMGAGKRIPHWDEKAEQFVPIVAGNLTLSFDHRVLDGGAAGRLLSRISELLQKPENL